MSSSGERYLYVSGAHVLASSHTVERYDIERDEWTELANMNIARHFHASCATTNTDLFIICGLDVKGNIINSIEWLNTNKKDSVW